MTEIDTDTDADPEPGDDAPARWVLGTPTRAWEVWGSPALLVVGAVLLAVVAALFPRVPVALRAAGFAASVGIVVGAVLLFVAGLRAYRELTYGASWRLHCTFVVVGHATMLVVCLLGLVVGYVGVASTVVLVSGFGLRRWTVPERPRFDVVAAIAVQLVVAAGCIVAIACAFLLPDVPDRVTAGWISTCVVLPVFAWSLLRERRALRTAPER